MPSMQHLHETFAHDCAQISDLCLWFGADMIWSFDGTQATQLIAQLSFDATHLHPFPSDARSNHDLAGHHDCIKTCLATTNLVFKLQEFILFESFPSSFKLVRRSTTSQVMFRVLKGNASQICLV
jgi:hypothetical protein